MKTCRLVREYFITAMIRWTGLAPWEFEFPFPGSLTSTFLEVCEVCRTFHPLVKLDDVVLP